MRFSISIDSVVLLTLYYGSVLEAARSPMPYWLVGYDCDVVPISGSRLQEVLSEVKYAKEFGKDDPKSQALLTDYYDGPPFTTSYLLWPVAPTAAGYHDEKASTPYRAVITNDNRIFSVIIKNKNNVKECILRYKGSSHLTVNLVCSGRIILNRDLLAAAKEACPLTRCPAKERFPARYNGYFFGARNKQLYTYPVIPGRSYNPNIKAGPYRIVMNSECKVVGAIVRNSKQNFLPCHRYGRSLLSRTDGVTRNKKQEQDETRTRSRLDQQYIN